MKGKFAARDEGWGFQRKHVKTREMLAAASPVSTVLGLIVAAMESRFLEKENAPSDEAIIYA